MKITNVTATVLRVPEISSAADGTQDDLIITVQTDEGITGYGEVDTAPYVGKAIIDAYMSHGTCYGLREVVVGADPFDYKPAVYKKDEGIRLEHLVVVTETRCDIVTKFERRFDQAGKAS